MQTTLRSQVTGHAPDATVEPRERVSACIAETGTWMKSNRLQLNTAKTEVVWFVNRASTNTGITLGPTQTCIKIDFDYNKRLSKAPH